MKPMLLRLHRWLALLFALPLAVVIVTGIILSFEPWLAGRSIQPGSLTTETVQALLAKHNPSGKAQALTYRSYDNTLSIGGRGGGVTVDAASGEVRAAPSGLASTLLTARRMHETLLLDAGWLVVASTFAMLAMSVLGVLLGWPTIRNTVAGWHKAMSWGLLPLIVLSPLTGLLMWGGITFSGGNPVRGPAQGAAPSLAEAVRLVGEKHDLSSLVWIRSRGGRMMARLNEGGEYRVYSVTKDGVTALPRNWPRLWHEGNFAGSWSALMNVVISLAMTGLLVTGLWIWLRRKLRRPTRQRGERETVAA